MLLFFLLLFFGSTSSGCNAALRFASTYGDHMVLQAAPYKAVLWGHTDKDGVTVSVTVNGKTSARQTTVSVNKLWKIKLADGYKASDTPYTITASSSEGSVSLHDVLFGDVWICSGQSNMVFTMAKINNSAAEISNALNYDKLRLFRAKKSESPTPFVDFPRDDLPWTVPTTDAVPGFSALCLLYGQYLYRHHKYPVGLVETAWGGTPIEPWSSPDALQVCDGTKTKRGPDTRSGLWNAMVAPLLPQTIYGAIWYQGEGNRGDPDKYACQFPAMIKDWRSKFHQQSMNETNLNFPFGFVQLDGNRDDLDYVGEFPEVRWSQTAKFGYAPNPKMPNTFMAVAMDLPDFTTRTKIHSRYKKDVAERLGLAGLAVAYGEKSLSYQGPFPTSFNTQTKGRLVIEYDHGHTALNVRGTKGFEICCSTSQNASPCGASDQWVPAPISDHHTTSIILNTTGCHSKYITALRYAWRESPCQFKKCAIYGRDNDLPAPPFLKYSIF